VALCEHCRAELVDGRAGRLPGPWFDHDHRRAAGTPLTKLEWQLLEILWRRRDRTVSVDSLMTLLYGHRVDNPPDDKIIDVFICKVRRKVDPTPYAIRTAWKEGYQLIDRKLSTTVIGGLEDDVPPPPRERPPRWGDKYGLAEMEVGQSRRIDNSKIEALKAACRMGQSRGHGRFVAGFDDRGKMRIWRV
jgi:hypothetical protein